MDGKTISELRVGEYAEKTDTITYENAERYAVVTGDYNPIHFDTLAARQSRYQKPIAHGMILAGFISGVIGTSIPGFGCIYETQSLSFRRPVFYGDVIRTRVTVAETTPERNRVTLRTECFNQSQELVLSGTAVVLPRRSEQPCSSST